MGNFNFIETKIKDLYIIEPKVFTDERGYFMETYNYNNTGYNEKDPFDLYKKLKDLQEYVFEKRNELKGE